MTQHVFHSDCRKLGLETTWANAFDAVVTDPPYGLSMRQWDYEVPSPDHWRAILAATKPGAHMVAFGGTKKVHRLICAIEDAGWEIRDSLAWWYGQGYPKSKGSLKPAYEPIALARKPGLEKAALNIDSCRIEVGSEDQKGGLSYVNGSSRVVDREHTGGIGFSPASGDPNDGKGRWPSNLCMDEFIAEALDATTGTLISGNVHKTYEPTPEASSPALGPKKRNLDPSKVYADRGGASRFFYVSKASRSERTHNGTVENDHVSVKPLDLMRWLVRLITPPGGLVLDPFCGSGTTLLAAKLEGLSAIGCDSDIKSVRIAEARLAA